MLAVQKGGYLEIATFLRTNPGSHFPCFFQLCLGCGLRGADPREECVPGGMYSFEYQMEQQQDDVSPFNAELRIGGLYDSRVGSGSDVGEEYSDKALAVTLTAGWQVPLTGDVKLRLDYNGYMDFHQDFGEYDVIYQSLAVSPQYRAGPFIFSIPLALNVALEAGEDDYVRYSSYPTITYLIPDTRQAVSFYGIGAQIDDRDKGRALDDDGETLGLGFAYLYAFENKSRVRLSLDYQHTIYDASVVAYETSCDLRDKRKDNTIMAGLDIVYQMTDHFGLYVNYALMRSNSNVSLYEFDRHVVQGGVVLRF